MSDDVTRRELLAGTTALATTATAGCVGDAERDETEAIEESYDVGDVSALAIEGHSEVTVRAEERDDVAVTGEKRAASEDGLDDVRLEADRDDGTLTLAVDRDDGPFVFRLGPGPTMGLSVAVPEDLRVERVETPNGRTEVSGIRGDTAIDVVNGMVTATDVRGGVDVEGTNGDVTASGVEGDLAVELTNGEVDADGVTGDVDVETTNGAVTIGVPADLGATIDLETTNGAITITGVGDLSGAEEFPVTVGDGSRRIDVETTNGDVTIDGSE